MRTWKPRWDPHIRFVGATCEDYGCLHGMQYEGRNLPQIRANLEIFESLAIFKACGATCRHLSCEDMWQH